MGLPEHDLARYERELDQAAAEEEFIAERVEFYMSEGGCCDPLNTEAFIDRLSEAVHDDCTVLKDRLEPLLKDEHIDYWSLGKAIMEYVNLASEELAEQFAKDDLRQVREEAKYHDC